MKMGKGKMGKGAMKGHETMSGKSTKPMPKDGITKGNHPRQGALPNAGGMVKPDGYQPAV